MSEELANQREMIETLKAAANQQEKSAKENQETIALLKQKAADKDKKYAAMIQQLKQEIAKVRIWRPAKGWDE